MLLKSSINVDSPLDGPNCSHLFHMLESYVHTPVVSVYGWNTTSFFILTIQLSSELSYLTTISTVLPLNYVPHYLVCANNHHNHVADAKLRSFGPYDFFISSLFWSQLSRLLSLYKMSPSVLSSFHFNDVAVTRIAYFAVLFCITI